MKGWFTWLTDFLATLNRHSQEPVAIPLQPVSAETLAPVCGSWVETPAYSGDDRLHCTYPAGHGPLIDADGHAWDHGLAKPAGAMWTTREEK